METVKPDFAYVVGTETALARRALNTLMGIVNGLVCDNDLTDQEIHFLATWLEENRGIASEYPANIVYRKVRETLADGKITADERKKLLDDLKVLSGNNFMETGSALPEHIRSVFDDDPSVEIPNRLFVLTGEFLFGTRASCERAILRRGGMVASSVTRRTNYLVVGTLASPQWIVQNFGRKIQRAAEMAESGEAEIAIVREADWIVAINDN
jgi:NAD-dependent DNA ligase